MGLAYWVKVCEEKSAIANVGVHMDDVAHPKKTVSRFFQPQQRSEGVFAVCVLQKGGKLR